jgi:hypothetical protein
MAITTTVQKGIIMAKPVKEIRPPYKVGKDGIVTELGPKKDKPMPLWWLLWIVPIGLYLAGLIEMGA